MREASAAALPTSGRRAGVAVAAAVVAAFFLFTGTGCNTYQTKAVVTRDQIRGGTASQAAAKLEPLANKESDDQLIYLLDYATTLQISGRYKESADAFNRAERIADVQDYHSLSRVASAALLSEQMIQYKGDDYEKVMIHAINASNYLEMGDLDGALVEVRKLNIKLHKYKTEAKRDYEQNPFAFYISAIIWEADRKYDDAYIAYKNAYEVNPSYPPLREDLIRAAIRAQRDDELAKWKKEFPEVQIKPEWKDKNMGEIVLVYQQGWGPRKQPRPENFRFPYLVPSFSETQQARLVIEGVKDTTTDRVFSVQQVAIKTLNDDYGRLIASRVGGVAAKAVMADQIRQKNELLGAVAWIAMNVADQADLRQWSTLPESLQIARLPLKAGKYKVKAIGLNGAGYQTSEQMAEREVEIKPGRKTFLNWRSVR